MRAADEVSTTHIGIAYPSASYSHPNLQNFYLMQNILSLSKVGISTNFLQSL
jgi:hypothetical protein